MLKTQRIHEEWSLEEIFGDGQWCPVCLGTEFVYIEGGGIYCDHCNASFTLRTTAGDPGVVIDCDADPQGVYASTELVKGETRTKRGNPYYFCQVLKSCNDGLNDRDHWMSQTKHSHDYTRDVATEQPCFARLNKFDAHHVASVQVYEDWLGTETYQELKAQYDAAEQWERDEIDRQMHMARSQYDLKRRPVVEKRLAALGRPEGLYFPHQCEKVFDDAFLVHRCIPKAGEQPVLTEYPIYKRPRDS